MGHFLQACINQLKVLLTVRPLLRRSSKAPLRVALALLALGMFSLAFASQTSSVKAAAKVEGPVETSYTFTCSDTATSILGSSDQSVVVEECKAQLNQQATDAYNNLNNDPTIAGVSYYCSPYAISIITNDYGDGTVVTYEAIGQTTCTYQVVFY